MARERNIPKNRAKTVGTRIKVLRDHLGFTQAEFAQELGRTQQYISKFEQGKQLVTLEVLLDICEKFDIDLGYFDPYEAKIEKILRQVARSHL